MFSLSESSHAVVRKVTKVLMGLAFLVALVGLATKDVQQYRKAQSILADAVTVDADVELLEVVESRGRRGRRSEEYHFGFSFAAGEQAYRGTFETSESGAEPYLSNPVVKVMYAKADPANFARESEVTRMGSLGAMLKVLGVELLIALVALALVYWVITGKIFKRKEKEDEHGAPAAA